MKRVVRLLFLLALLPLFGKAQVSATLDSVELGLKEDTAAVDTDTAAAVPPKVHYLWDQEVPVSVDSLDDEDEGGELVLRQVPASLIKEFKEDKKLQYTKEPPKKPAFAFFEYVQIFFFFLAKFVSTFYWILIILVVLILGIILYNYLKGQGYIFRGKGAIMDDGMVALSEEELDLATYEKQIQAAVTGGKYRLAVRLLYLQTLRLLADKEVIIFSKEKTNATYLRALAQTKWYKSFATLTLDYEYIWYGEIPVNDTQFSAIHKDFSRFMNELGYTR